MSQVIHDEFWQVRLEAAEALGNIGDRRALPALTDAMRDEHEEVRIQVANAIGDINE